ncbi:MAG TPA: polyprenyl diphosphate synthase [Candidatus Paceibacterota bacterium]|nr:polyprenyl diphosphate synthase [Candidatus Paceibacterota bacterium]
MQESKVQCIGIILDGNRRWAKKHGMPKLLGHHEGRVTLENAVRWVRERGIPNLVVFMFSTENWKREKEEVDYLMELFRESVKEDIAELAKEGVRVRYIGQRERFAKDLQEVMDKAERDTEHNTAITLWCCLSYGSRAEITEAAKSLAASGEEITEETLRSHFWSAEMPDPDIIIRTGGEQRLSNFLLWQAAYSELFFIDEYWPDFSEKLLDQILEEYAARERRHGK